MSIDNSNPPVELAPELTDVRAALSAADSDPAPQPTEPTEPTEPIQPAPEPTEPVSEVTEPAEPASTEEEINNRAFIEFARTRGLDLGDKYADDIAAIDGLANAYHMVGQRNADAELGRAIKASGRESDIVALLNGQQPAQPTQPESVPEQQPTFEEYELWKTQIQQDDNGNLMPAPGAPLDVVQKYQAATKQIQKAAFDLAHKPTQLLEPAIQQQSAVIQQQLQQTLAQQAMSQQQAMQVRNWAEQNRSFLFVDGDPQRGLTTQGRDFCRHFDQSGEPSFDGKVRYATAIMRGSQPPSPPPTPKPQATHKPAVGTPPEPDPEKAYQENVKNLSLRDHLLLAAKQRELQTGVAK